VPGPQLGPEHAEGQVRVREELCEERVPRSAVARVVAVELGRIRLGGPQQERALAVGVQRARRQLGVQVLEPVSPEVVAELRVRRATDPERMPCAEDVVVEPRLRQLRGLDRTAEPVVALQHAHVPPRLREQSGAREPVDAAADDDRVVVSHVRAP
jgi:hypothetical protein